MARPAPRLRPRPGAYSRAPVWASRAHWLQVVLPAAVEHGREVLRRHHISPITFTRVMVAHAQHGDDRTGRDCHPDVDHLRIVAQCSERTVQRPGLRPASWASPARSSAAATCA